MPRPDGRRLFTASCGIRAKWPSGGRTPLYIIYPFFCRATNSKISSSWSSVKPITFSAIFRFVPTLDSPPKNTLLREKSFFSRPRNASTIFGGIFVERLKWDNFYGKNSLRPKLDLFFFHMTIIFFSVKTEKIQQFFVAFSFFSFRSFSMTSMLYRLFLLWN